LPPRVPGRKGKPHKVCKSCTAAYKQQWAEANSEKVARQKKAYELANPERVVKAKRDCYMANRERYLRECAARKVINRDEINARNRELFAARHEPMIGRIKRRVEREKNASGTFTKENEAELLVAQCGKCAGCHSLLMGKYHVDHIVPLVHGGSHWPENRQILCVTCNHRKGTRMPDEWARIIERNQITQ
jgi:5-methylcytosine-specific restriction endonuclease McrA